MKNNIYLTEILNSPIVNGFPLRRVKLIIGEAVMLLRNLNIKV